MTMTRDEYQDKLTFILGHPGETADISQRLNELRTGFDDSLRQVETLTSQAAALQATNEKLVKQNMDLFLQAGAKDEGSGKELEDKTDDEVLADLVDPKTGKFKLA